MSSSEKHFLYPNRPQRWVQQAAATRTGSVILAPLLHILDRPFIRLSKGRTSLTSLLTGLPVITLTTKGARTGLPRTVPLIAIPEDGRLILVASNFGQERHPAWYYNLIANPEALVSNNGSTRTYQAQLVSEPDSERYWTMASAMYPGYLKYRQRAHQRKIGIFQLTAADAGETSPT